MAVVDGKSDLFSGDVDPARLGERVLVEPVFRGADRFDVRYFGSEVDGAFADYACVPAIHAHRVESALTEPDTQLRLFGKPEVSKA